MTEDEKMPSLRDYGAAIELLGPAGEVVRRLADRNGASRTWVRVEHAG